MFNMEYSLFSKEKVNRRKKKIIPWHVQKRYMESLSQLSLNQTLATAFYKRQINSLKRNNKHLAVALQQSRFLATEKENLMLENGKILDIINFSRLKLMDMATNMKQATACLDETLLLLNSAKDNLSKCSPNNRNCRNVFKSKLQEINIEPIKEVLESASEKLNSVNQNALSTVHKGKKSHVDDCISPPHKKCKIEKKEKVKINKKDAPKSSALSNAAFKNSSVKNSEKCDSGNKIKSRRKKSLPKSTVIKSSSSSKSSPTSSNRSLHGKNKRNFPEKKCKAVKVMLTDIADSFVQLDTENSPKTNKLVSCMTGTSFKCFAQNSDQDNILIKKFISSEVTSKASSRMNSCSPTFVSTINDAEVLPSACTVSDKEVYPSVSTINDAEVLPFASTINDGKVYPSVSTINDAERCPFLSAVTAVGDYPLDSICETEVVTSSQDTSNSSNFSPETLPPTVSIPVIVEDLLALPSEENKDLVFDPTCVVVETEGFNNTGQNNPINIKNFTLKKDKHKSRNSIIPRKGNFYFDEDSIERADLKTTASKTKKMHKNINKTKARKTVSKSTAMKSNYILPENVSKLGKNSFLVTAEVHPPPNTVNYAKEMKSKMCVPEKREPCVVLTDIFKSNQGLLSEMVSNSLRENECLQTTATKSDKATFEDIPATKTETNYMDCESNSENRCLLPADRKIIEEKRRQARAKVVSYKEPSLNSKMRRLR